MSYVSFLRNIPEFLSQPTGIAAVASLGIHGAIAFLLPIVPMSSKAKQEPSSKSSVGVVELSQAEKNRLPQPGTPQLSLQPPVPVLPQIPPSNFANQSTTPSSLASVPPSASSTALILPPLPKTNNTPLTLPPLPKTNNVAIASLPKSQSLPILSKKDLPPEPSLSAKVRPLPRYPEKVQLGETKPLESSKIPYNVPPVQAANIPQEQQELVNTSAPGYPDQMPTSAEGSSATQTTEAGNEVPQVANNQQLVTPVVQPPQVGDNSIALRGQSFPQLPQGSSIQAPELPPLATARSLSTPNKTFAERVTEAKSQYPDLETRQPIAATVDAKTAEEGKVEGDLVVNREGQVESIEFHNNSVASDLKTSVREYFREYFQKNPVQANGKPKLYPFNISFKPNNNISKTPASELSTSSLVTQTQPVTAAQRSLIQRLRSAPVNAQVSQEPKKVNLVSQEPKKVNLAERLRPVEVNFKPSKEPQKLNLTERSSSSSIRQQVSQTQTESKPQANQEQQTSRRRRVMITQSTSAPQASPEQTSRQQVVIRQSASSSQTDKEQQTSQQQVVVKQSTSAPQASPEQTSQQEVSSNQPSASGETSKKLLQQLRQIRDKRQSDNQGDNQEK
ncbi:hypothetical protein [Brasilonema sp. UFV-L1]|uniref:hypothetical protein n=1 Tax=Brasilonema sp. UFV-L1 TaxID=2234130 RepID=UPI00145DF742|nr:hypothetical protein [Brasilonema sp. UFV-L1]NMG06778.1 hypothetical protein [Brasilonema sp. UFV-L1]